MKKQVKSTAKYAGIVILSMVIGANMTDTDPEVVTKTKIEKVTDSAAVDKIQKELDQAKEEIQTLAQENETLVAEASAIQEEKDAQEDKKKEEAKKAAAKPVSLGPGEFVVGEDIEPGRYEVSVTSGGGNFFVYDESGWAVVNEMLGTNTDFYVNNITINIEEGNIIKISGLNTVNFKLK
jgi:uncharacterized protein YlxW (UPF0749 family)